MSKPERILRDRIKSDLASDTFRPVQWRLFWFIPLFLSIFVYWYLLIAFDLAWYWNLLLALLIGNSFGSLGFLGHEVSHGAMGIDKQYRDIICFCAFTPFFVTPEFWHRWHNIAHHGNTNMGDKDPDSFGTIKRYEKRPQQKFLPKLAPGSGSWYSYLFLFYSFTLHSQAVLWLQTAHRSEFEGFNRKKAILGMLCMLAFWVTLAWYFGGEFALFGLFIPFLIGNAVIQSYILTNHFLRPQAETNNPIENSMSLKSLAIFDRLHFHFSHHIEHHLFPKMPSCNAPKVRQWLLEHEKDRYVCPSHSTALKLLYSTPRVYLNPTTLVDVNAPQRTIDLSSIDELLKPNFSIST